VLVPILGTLHMYRGTSSDGHVAMLPGLCYSLYLSTSRSERLISEHVPFRALLGIL